MFKGKRYIGAAAAAIMAAGMLTACGGEGDKGSQSGSAGGDGDIKLTIAGRGLKGTKGGADAVWKEDWVIPHFEEMMKEQGKNVTVTYEPVDASDDQWKTKLALDLQSGGGGDIIDIDGLWVGELAEAGYIKPLEEIYPASSEWDGWNEVPEAVLQSLSFEGQLYGMPNGADGRVIYYNKDLFKQAGLPEEWQPTSWDEILEACRKLKELDGVLPIQLNAGTAMGEATTMQGVLPMLAGTGELIFEDGQWMGDTEGMRDVLNLYKTIYIDEGLGDPLMQQETSARDNTFEMFSTNEIGILLEGDYFWRSVINPETGSTPMENRDEVVGYAKIPAIKGGEGVFGQDFVSLSGGTGRLLNKNTKHPEEAWELLAFMSSREAQLARAEGSLNITMREDVNDEVFKNDPMLLYVSQEVLPLNVYRPPVTQYALVSQALQEATLDIVSGKSETETMENYLRSLESAVGADAVRSN